MQDRVPLYPGRVKLKPVSGAANTYTLTRDDQPTQAGTPLNKATFLKDATAALYSLGTDAVPDDVLSILSKAVLLNNNSLESITGSPIVAIRKVSGTYTGTDGSSVTLSTGIPVKLVFVYGTGQSTENLAILTDGISRGFLFTGNSNAGGGTNYIGKFNASFSSTTVRLSSLGSYRYYINQNGQSYSWTAFG